MVQIGIEFVEANSGVSNLVNNVADNASYQSSTSDLLYVIVAALICILGVCFIAQYIRNKIGFASGNHVAGTSLMRSKLLSRTFLIIGSFLIFASGILFVTFHCQTNYAQAQEMTDGGNVNITCPDTIKAYVDYDTNSVWFDDSYITNNESKKVFINGAGLYQNTGSKDLSQWLIKADGSELYKGVPGDMFDCTQGVSIDANGNACLNLQTNMTAEFASSFIGSQNAYSLSLAVEELPFGYELANSPIIIENCVYNGLEQMGVQTDDTIVVTGDVSATNAGNYSFEVKPAKGHMWEDLTTSTKTFTWSIKKADASINIAETDVSLYIDQSYVVAYEYVGDGQGSAASSDESVAKVSSLKEASIEIEAYAIGFASVSLKFSEGENYKSVSADINVRVKRTFTGQMDYPCGLDYGLYSINISFDWDPYGFMQQDWTQYSKDLAKLNNIVIGDFYNDSRVRIDGYEPWEAYHNKILYEKVLNMSDVVELYLNPLDYELDQEDISSFLIMHMPMYENGIKKEFIMLAFKGTTSASVEEWSSDFDVGATSDAYMQYPHPEWLSKNNHKGFDVIFNRFMPKISDYLDKYVDKNAEKRMLLTGHSKGAAVSNLVAREFNTNSSFSDYTMATYSFATPNPSIPDEGEKYINIFDICNFDDSICFMPIKKWGFSALGTESGFDAHSNTEFLERWKETGLDYSSGSGTAIEAILNKYMPDRIKMYDLFSEQECEPYISDEFDTLEEAQAEFDNFMAVIYEIGLDKYNLYELKQDPDTQTYYYQATISPSFLAQALASLIATAESGDIDKVYEYLGTVGPVLGTLPEEIVECITLMLQNPEGFIQAHCPIAYYLIVDIQ